MISLPRSPVVSLIVGHHQDDIRRRHLNRGIFVLSTEQTSAKQNEKENYRKEGSDWHGVLILSELERLRARRQKFVPVIKVVGSDSKQVRTERLAPPVQP